MEHAWRAALGRWGDELWGLALLRTGNRAGAKQVLVRAFERVYTAKTPPTDAHTALTQALVPPRRRRLPRVFRQAALPRALWRVGATERMLLQLWLVHGRNGAELARVTQLPTPAIHDQLARALVRFVPRRNIARRTPDGRAAWGQWLGQQLQLNPEPLPDTIPETTLAVWQAALSRVRDLLTLAVERQRLPGTVRDAIETTLLAREDETPAWQRKIGWLALATLLLVGGWIFLRSNAQAPAAQTTAPANPAQQPVDAHTLVQNALDAWTTMPISGTLHRRVWAVDERPIARDQVHTTEVWLASDKPQYRVETTRDGTLIEWHVVDTKAQLHTASDVPFNMCHWSYGPGVGAARAQTFRVPSDQVRAVRDERLRSGSYGEGYRMLHRALQAPNLRSYGVRNEHDRVLVTLGFRDEATTPTRTVLLLLDGRTHELQTVRELVGDAAQTTARDLWRLEAEETLPAVPAALPPSEREAIVADDIIDPACPGLVRDYVISLRRMAATGYAQIQIPVPLPNNVVQAALVSSVPDAGGDYNDVYNAQLVLRSATGWLHIRPSQGSDPNSSAPDQVERGAWVVHFRNEDNVGRPIVATVWQNEQRDPSTGMHYDGQAYDIEASGWTRDQVLDVVDRLRPLDERTWPALAPKFLDPHPLPADVVQVLIDAQQALRTQPDGTVHVTMNATARTGPQQGERADPYHVPSSITSPDAWTVEQWATVGGGTVQRFKQVATHEDGALLFARLLSPTQSGLYIAQESWTYQSSQDNLGPYGYGEQMLGVDFARPLLAWDAPITMTTDGNLWHFEQTLPGNAGGLMSSGFWSELIRNEALVNNSTMYDLPPGEFVLRVSFDRAQLLPRHWEAIHREPSGAETVLHTIALRDWRPLPTPLPDAFWSMPALPPDTFLTEADGPTYRRMTPLATVGGPLSLVPPKRALVWSANSGLETRNDTPYRIPPQTDAEAWLYDPWSLRDVTQLQNMGLVRTTVYHVGDSNRSITVRQGPRTLLRAVLRQSGGFFNAPYSSSSPESTQQSEQVQVTIANEQYDAWLLRGATGATLIVEIDDMLVHITGPADYVGGVLLEQLPALEWEPVVLAQGGGGGAIEVQP